ncbi:MAG: pilus assembly protein PilP [Nitrospiria bacterium]
MKIRQCIFQVKLVTGMVLLQGVLLISCSMAETPPAVTKPPSVLPLASETLTAEPEEALAASPAGRDEAIKAPIFRYDPKGRRDPFRSIVASRGRIRNPRAGENLPPLQRKDISELKLIGIIWGSLGPSAIITVPTGEGYPVRVGTRIGLNRGVVKRITQNAVVVEETHLNMFGETDKSDVVMELHPDKEMLE